MSKESKKERDAWYRGVLFSLTVLDANIGTEVAAVHLVREIGGIEELERVAKESGVEQDMETIEWLKQIGAR